MHFILDVDQFCESLRNTFASYEQIKIFDILFNSS